MEHLFCFDKDRNRDRDQDGRDGGLELRSNTNIDPETMLERVAGYYRHIDGCTAEMSK